MDKIKFLMDDNVSIKLFVKGDKQFILISSDEADDCEYEVKTFSDIGKYVADYIRENIIL